jgi:glycine C-acetyltransferase
MTKITRLNARVSVHGTATAQTAATQTAATQAAPAPSDGARAACDVTNLSASGALLVGAHFEVGTELDVALEAVTGSCPEVRARVVRAEKMPDGRPSVGVAFLDVSPEADAALTRIVTEGYKALGARILGLVRADLARRGITDVRVVAEELQRIREEQAKAHLFSADLFTERGSDTTATIISAATGETRECIVWSLNLYLGLNRSPRVQEKVRQAVSTYGTGCGTSAPSGGLNFLHRRIEKVVADMTGKQKAIVFPTGYSANLGALSALPGPKDLLLLDREAHASMIDGAKLSGKKWLAFKHNDVADLAEKLRRYGPHHENVIVGVESAYSMSGDLSPLKEIAALKKDHRFLLYVDEAHTFGFYGEGGRGWCHEQGVQDDVDFIMTTFSKATASLGGVIAAEEKYCTLLQASATPYIFQACLSPPDAATILACLEELRENPGHAKALHDNNALFRDLLTKAGFDLGTSRSPVVPVYVPDLEKLYRLCAKLYLDGIYSVPVVYPAVAVDAGRIRFIVNASHTREQIERTAAALATHAMDLGILRA